MGESGDVSQKYLEDNIKQFENQFEEMVAKQVILTKEHSGVIHFFNISE